MLQTSWCNVNAYVRPLSLSLLDSHSSVYSVVLSFDFVFVLTIDLFSQFSCFVRQSVVQATKSARMSVIQWYIGVAFAILFFGGFLFKSWNDERILERDTRRLLAYYKHVLPGSMLDGDENNARYVAYKYRNKKEKLWRGLEKKYDIPVLQEDEWEGWSENGGEDEDHEDLDTNEDTTDEKEQEL